jgi:hypothetical protein
MNLVQLASFRRLIYNPRSRNMLPGATACRDRPAPRPVLIRVQIANILISNNQGEPFTLF